MKLSIRCCRVIALFFTTLSFSQTPRIDSLKNVLPSSAGTVRLKVLDSLANSLENIYPKQALEYAREGIPLAIEFGDSLVASRLYASAAFSLSELGDFTEGLKYGRSSLAIAERIGDKRRISSASSVLGIISVYLGQYSRALEYHLEALRIREELHLLVPTIATLNNIGIVYHNIGQYDKAIEYYKRAYDLQKQTTNWIPLIRFMTNIGYSEFRRGNFEIATKYHVDALALAEQLKFSAGMAYTLYNLGIMNAEQKKYAEAIEYLQRSLAINEEVGKKYGIIEVLNALGKTSLKVGKFADAKKYLERAIALAEQENTIGQLEKSYESMYTVYDSLKSEKLSYRYFKLFSAVKDSLYRINESKKIAELSIRVELLDKQREIELLKKEKIIADLHLEQQRYRSDILYTGIVSLVIVIVILFWNVRSSKRSKKNVERTNAELERLNAELQKNIEQINVLNRKAQQDVVKKADLLHEVNHRVKNNLFSILGLIVSEKRYAQGANKAVVAEVMDGLERRIEGMLAVHQILSDSQWSAMKLSDLAQHIVGMVIRSNASDRNVKVQISPSDIYVSPRQANNLALIFNELVTNSIKYGLTETQAPELSVTIATNRGDISIIYRDNGSGFSDDVVEHKRYNVGLTLIRQLVTESLQGKIELKNENGAVVICTFPSEDKIRT
ncbi:MAG: tetratricopeptide repeat protein [Bacteroidota bacterium]|jgi:two-component sensor histidine kinase/Tfp pilus assembly protein PilF